MKNRNQRGEATTMVLIILVAAVLSIITTAVKNKNPDGVSVIQAEPSKQEKR